MYVMYVLSMIYEVEGLALKLLYGLHFPRLDPFGLGSIFSCSSEIMFDWYPMRRCYPDYIYRHYRYLGLSRNLTGDF